MSNRIYGDVIDINSKDVQSFYDGRAQNTDANRHVYSAVLLSDHSPELIEEQIKIEREAIFPKLNINNESKILDIGCGIGRWAEIVIPLCAYYHGVDFSQSMIDRAKERVSSFNTDNHIFQKASFQDFVKSACGVKFNRVIISNVLMYIGDSEIKECLQNLLGFLDEKCGIYIYEPCGVGQRLTLKDFPSEALKGQYNAIYRTKAEYNEIFEAFTGNGFSIVFNEYYSAPGGTATYTDTDKTYYILER